MHWAEAQLVVSRTFVAIVVVGLVSPVLVSSASSIVVTIILAAIILVVAAVVSGSGDLYATLVLRVATAWRWGRAGLSRDRVAMVGLHVTRDAGGGHELTWASCGGDVAL
ncbi:hypothetical protein EDB85DRAFT_1891217 [Lactarius pseudohatsudake]|nr:hypothetical protein EDB85DRAFT_1891217 [Lactarius pseudohatsudake]